MNNYSYLPGTGDGTFGFVVFLAVGLYFLPWVVALCRGHHNAGAIFLVNLLFGWCFLGWVIAMIWAVSRARREAAVAHTPIQQTVIVQIQASDGRIFEKMTAGHRLGRIEPRVSRQSADGWSRERHGRVSLAAAPIRDHPDRTPPDQLYDPE